MHTSTRARVRARPACREGRARSDAARHCRRAGARPDREAWTAASPPTPLLAQPTLWRPALGATGHHQQRTINPSNRFTIDSAPALADAAKAVRRLVGGQPALDKRTPRLARPVRAGASQDVPRRRHRVAPEAAHKVALVVGGGVPHHVTLALAGRLHLGRTGRRTDERALAAAREGQLREERHRLGIRPRPLLPTPAGGGGAMTAATGKSADHAVKENHKPEPRVQ